MRNTTTVYAACSRSTTTQTGCATIILDHKKQQAGAVLHSPEVSTEIDDDVDAYHFSLAGILRTSLGASLWHPHRLSEHG